MVDYCVIPVFWGATFPRVPVFAGVATIPYVPAELSDALDSIGRAQYFSGLRQYNARNVSIARPSVFSDPWPNAGNGYYVTTFTQEQVVAFLENHLGNIPVPNGTTPIYAVVIPSGSLLDVSALGAHGTLDAAHQNRIWFWMYGGNSVQGACQVATHEIVEAIGQDFGVPNELCDDCKATFPEGRTMQNGLVVETYLDARTSRCIAPGSMKPISVAVASWERNRLDIFGLGTDSQLYHKAWDGSAWYPSQTNWEALGGRFNSPPAVASWGSDRLDIFGLGKDNQMYHKAWDGTAWFNWEALGGTFNSPPAVVAWGSNRLDIFGLGTDNQMYHKAWDGNAWYPSQTNWEALGGTFNSPPAVASWGSDRLDIFGLGTDNQMYHKAWDGNAWYPSQTNWEPLGGTFNSPPAVASWGSDRLDIFGLGTDNQMYHKAWNGTAWFDWEALGGVFNSAAAVVSWGNDRLDIFGLGADNQMYHKAWDGNAWFPSQTNWEALGGTFEGFPFR
jgi:hypothetical protein